MLYDAPTSGPAAVLATSTRPDQGLDWVPKTLSEHIRWHDRFAATSAVSFDRNKNGKLEFEEFLDEAFTVLCLYVRPGGKLDQSAFLQAMLGPETDPVTRAVLRSPRADVYIKIFGQLDRQHKGYLTKADIIPWQRAIFRRADRNHDGAVEPHEADVGR